MIHGQVYITAKLSAVCTHYNNKWQVFSILIIRDIYLTVRKQG